MTCAFVATVARYPGSVTLRRRFQHPGAIYHAYCTGAGGISIVCNDEDRELWVKALGITVDRFGLDVLAWCLMTTHWHLLVETPKANIGDAMRWLNGVYAQGFNKRHGRRGHLFGARYDTRVIQTDRQLLESGRYIALNPVEAGIVERPAAYAWGSYGFVVAGVLTWPANAAWKLVRAAGGLEAFREFVEAGCMSLVTPE